MMDQQTLYARAFDAIQNIRLGKRIRSACRAAAISYAQLMELSSKDPAVAEHLTLARKECDEMLAEALVDVDEFQHYGAQDPKMAAVWSKNAQWLLAKNNPEKYGEKVTVETKSSIDVMITQRLENAKLRLEDLDAKDIEIVSSSLPPLPVPKKG